MNGIKIGRISKKAEKALGKDLGNDIFLYVDNARLDELSRKRPETYLKDLEELSKMVSSPDYVRYDGKELSFVREYVREGTFRKCMASFSFGERWELGYFGSMQDVKAKELGSASPFKKVG